MDEERDEETYAYQRLRRAVQRDYYNTPNVELLLLAAQTIEDQRGHLLEVRRWQNMLWAFSSSMFWIGAFAATMTISLILAMTSGRN